MPLFAYRCVACDTRTEMLVRGDESVTCPECGSSRMERQLSRFAPMSGASPEPACSGCALSQGCGCPAQGGCTH